MQERVRGIEVLVLLALSVAFPLVVASVAPRGLWIDLPLILTVYVGWMGSSARGATAGAAFGLLQDWTLGISLGVNGISKTLIGFSASYLRKWIATDNRLARLLVLAVFAFVDNGLVYSMLMLLGEPLPASYPTAFAGELVATALAGILVFHVYDRIKFPRKDFRDL